GRHPHRLGDRRDHLRSARHGPLLHPGRAQPRLHAGHGGGRALCHADHRAQPAGRPALRGARSQGAVRLMATVIIPAPPSDLEIEGGSLWRDARIRLFRNRAAVASMIILAIIALLAILAPYLSPHAYDQIYYARIRKPPDFAHYHWFGTD